MSYLQEIKKEIREGRINENHKKSMVIQLQTAYLKDNPKCVKCGADKNITYDHIIPCSLLNDFNIDPYKEFWEDNSQSMCRACNVMKANHLDFSNPKTADLLHYLILQKLSTDTHFSTI